MTDTRLAEIRQFVAVKRDGITGLGHAVTLIVELLDEVTRLRECELWLVGRTKDLSDWEVQGIYDSEDAAVARCEDWRWFVMPLTVNELVPSESILNHRAYRPTAEGSPT